MGLAKLTNSIVICEHLLQCQHINTPYVTDLLQYRVFNSYPRQIIGNYPYLDPVVKTEIINDNQPSFKRDNHKAGIINQTLSNAGYYHPDDSTPDKTPFMSLIHYQFPIKMRFCKQNQHIHSHSYPFQTTIRSKTHLKRRRGRFKQQGIRLVSENRRFGPQAAQPTRARIQVIQVIRNPSPPFNQDTNMVQLQPRTTSNLLQRCDL